MEYKTKFLERIERTATSVSYRFERPKEFTFTAGKYMLVDLGEKLVHPLSLSDCPEETEFIEFTKRMTGSPFCRRLESLEKGESVKVKGPSGEFFCNESCGTLIMIAGGIGITPIRSILKSREKNGGDQDKIILIYGNLNREDIAFKDELESLNLADYRVVHVLSDNTGMEKAYKGFISAEILSKEVPEKEKATYMISGPPVMVEAIKKALATINVGDARILTDLFVGYDA